MIELPNEKIEDVIEVSAYLNIVSFVREKSPWGYSYLGTAKQSQVCLECVQLMKSGPHIVFSCRGFYSTTTKKGGRGQ